LVPSLGEFKPDYTDVGSATAGAFSQLVKYAGIRPSNITGPTVTRNSPFIHWIWRRLYGPQVGIVQVVLCV